MRAIGRTCWAMPGGHIPLESTGPEPACTSHDALSLLNTGDEMANVRVTIYYADREPVGPYRITVAPRRMRQVRLNDLIFPEAIPLDTDYAAVVESDIPIVVQFTRQDTGQPPRALLGTLAYPVE